MRSIVNKLDQFVKDNDWLSSNDAVALESLYMMAELLDNDPVANSKLFGVFGLTYRALIKSKPGESAPVDELESLLEEANGMV